MRIKGSNKADILAGSVGSDLIEGGRGNDRLSGNEGDDTLVGGVGADTFILRSGGGDDVVVDFDAASGDRVMFDYGTYSDIMVFGRLADGQTWTNFNGTATFGVTAADVNGDGITDTILSANDDSITLLGVAPDQLWGNCLFGGRCSRVNLSRGCPAFLKLSPVGAQASAGLSRAPRMPRYRGSVARDEFTV